MTKMITSGLLSVVSDIFAQRLGSDKKKFSIRRAFSLLAVGALLTAPMFHYLYAAFEVIKPRGLRVGVALVMDQLVAAPVWLVLFFTMVSAFEGVREWKTIDNQIRRDFIPSIKLVWLVFPAVQVVNFSLVPVRLQVLVLNVCDLIFTAALSWIQHR